MNASLSYRVAMRRNPFSLRKYFSARWRSLYSRLQQREPEVDGRKGFLVLDKNNMPCLANHWEKRFQYALGKYNRIYKEQLPMITPHICRHTFCTNMAKSGVSPKTLQYLMGHSDIATTLGVYTHLKFEDAEKELKEREKESKKLK